MKIFFPLTRCRASNNGWNLSSLLMCVQMKSGKFSSLPPSLAHDSPFRVKWSVELPVTAPEKSRKYSRTHLSTHRAQHHQFDSIERQPMRNREQPAKKKIFHVSVENSLSAERESLPLFHNSAKRYMLHEEARERDESELRCCTKMALEIFGRSLGYQQSHWSLTHCADILSSN